MPGELGETPGELGETPGERRQASLKRRLRPRELGLGPPKLGETPGRQLPPPRALGLSSPWRGGVNSSRQGAHVRPHYIGPDRYLEPASQGLNRLKELGRALGALLTSRRERPSKKVIKALNEPSRRRGGLLPRERKARQVERSVLLHAPAGGKALADRIGPDLLHAPGITVAPSRPPQKARMKRDHVGSSTIGSKARCQRPIRVVPVTFPPSTVYTSKSGVPRVMITPGGFGSQSSIKSKSASTVLGMSDLVAATRTCE